MTQQPWQPQNYPQAPPPGYGQPQYQQAPPAQYPGTAPAGEPEAFGKAAPATGGESVKVHQLEGRLVLFRPVSYNPAAPGYGSNPPGPQIVAEAIVMDGPPVAGLVDGRNGQVTKPFATGPKNPPFYAQTVYISHDILLKQLADAVPSRSFILGRIGKGQATGTNSAPFKIIDPTEQDEQLARSVIGNRIQDGFDRIKAASAPEPQQPFAGAPAAYSPVQAQATGNGWSQQAPAQPVQPQPYQQPTPQQYPPQGPPGAPWGQPQQYPPQGPPEANGGDPWAGTSIPQQDAIVNQLIEQAPPWAQPQQAPPWAQPQQAPPWAGGQQ